MKKKKKGDKLNPIAHVSMCLSADIASIFELDHSQNPIVSIERDASFDRHLIHSHIRPPPPLALSRPSSLSVLPSPTFVNNNARCLCVGCATHNFCGYIFPIITLFIQFDTRFRVILFTRLFPRRLRPQSSAKQYNVWRVTWTIDMWFPFDFCFSRLSRRNLLSQNVMRTRCVNGMR